MIDESLNLAREYTFDSFVEGLINREFDNETKANVAKNFNISRKTLWNWEQKVDWAYVLEERRKRYKQVTTEVDASLIRKANGGDTRAMEVYYQRFDDWTPETAVVEKNQDVINLAEKLKAELLAKRAENPTPSMPGTGEAKT